MFRKSYIILFLFILIIGVTGCNYLTSNEQVITGEVIEIGGNNTGNNTMVDISGEDKTTTSTNTTKEDTMAKETYPENMVKIEKIEGDLISLRPDAYDPDGDKVKYAFSEPFQNAGLWQTKEGDVGEYKVTITASDGKLSTSEDVLVIVKPTNKPPRIECPDEMNFKETDLIKLDCKIYDLEGEEVIVQYTGWMTASKYQSTYGDAGTHKVLITAYDGNNKTTVKEVTVNVEKLNRAPIIQDIGVDGTLTGEETDTIRVSLTGISDPDGDKLTYVYGEPLNKNGVWKTKLGDAGTYDSYVIVSDGQSSVRKEFQIVLTQKNTAPTLKHIDPINVDEGDEIIIPVESVDREGDKLTVKISGWMTSDRYTTTYEDGGVHTVTVSVTDGTLTTVQDVEITVNNVNRAPIFKVVA